MGLTKPRAYQIYDLDYKQAVRVVTISNITLSGGAPALVDGVSLSVNDRVLVTGQSSGSQNGIYDVDVVGSGSNGTWTRSIDVNQTGELDSGTIVMVTEGSIYADTQWKLTTDDPIVIGTTALVFVQNYSANSISSGTSNVVVNSNANVTISSAGTPNVLIVTSTGVNVSGYVTAAGNVTGDYILGNGALLTGVITSVANINNGTSNVNVVSSGGNVTVGIAGTSNVAVFSSTGANITGTLGVSGNITGGNLTTAGLISATGNVTGGNLSGTSIAGTLTTAAQTNITSLGTLGSLIVTANVAGGNLTTAGQVSAAGNITGSNLLVNGNTVITGNLRVDGTETIFNVQTISVNDKDIIVANNVTGGANIDGAGIQAGNPATATWFFNNATTSWQSNIGITPSANGTLSLGGASNYWGTAYLTVASVTGNVTGGNLTTAGVVRATGDVFGKELWSTQSSGDEGGQINLGIPATNTSLTGQVTIDIYQNRLRFFQGNNAKGAYIDLTAAADGVGTNLLAGGGGGTPGGSNTYVQFNDAGAFGGNANFTYDKVFNTVNAGTFAGTINGLGQNFKVGDDAWIGDINIDNTIGLKGQQNAADCYVVFGNSDATGKLGRSGTGPLTYAGAFSATGNVTGGNITTGGNVVATGNVSGGNVAASTAVYSFGTVTGVGNVAGGNLTTGGQVSATGNVTGGNLIQGGTRVIKWTTVANTAPTNAVPGDFWYDSFADIKYQYTNDGTSNVWIDQSYPTSFSTLTVQNIVNGGANGTGNIGSSVGQFNTAFVKATSAQYADLAEIYEADQEYSPGTVVVFGGDKEITVTDQSHDTRVAGVISTDPAFIMNSHAAGLPVAFTGRVPCRVQGPVVKGDVLVTGAIPGVAQRIGYNYQPGCVLGKSLQTIADNSIQTIEVVVGRF